MKISRKYAFIAAAALMASSITMCGCEKKNNSSSENNVIYYNSSNETKQLGADNSTSENQVPAETEKQNESSKKEEISETAAEVEIEYVEGNIGETAEQKGISVNLEKVEFFTDQKTTDDTKLAYAMFSIKNVTSDDIKISRLENFTLSIDGQSPSVDAITSVRASSEAIQKLGDSGKLNGTIGSGNSLEGYIAFEIPENASEIEIVYYPYKYSQNQTNDIGYRFKINVADMGVLK